MSDVLCPYIMRSQGLSLDNKTLHHCEVQSLMYTLENRGGQMSLRIQFAPPKS